MPAGMMPDAARGPVYGRARGTAPAPPSGSTLGRRRPDERDGPFYFVARHVTRQSAGRIHLLDPIESFLGARSDTQALEL